MAPKQFLGNLDARFIIENLENFQRDPDDVGMFHATDSIPCSKFNTVIFRFWSEIFLEQRIYPQAGGPIRPTGPTNRFQIETNYKKLLQSDFTKIISFKQILTLLPNCLAQTTQKTNFSPS